MLKNKKPLIVSSLLILLPIAAGLLLWNRLPDQMPTHWNAAGEADSYSSRGFAVFGLPLILLLVHWVCLFVTHSDKKNNTQNPKLLKLPLWICPIVSIFGSAAIYSTVLGHPIDMSTLPCLLVGALFLVIGNYLPKCKHNYTIGIKLPWTLASEENWNATHRLGGKVWVIGGLIIALTAFLPDTYVFPLMMLTMLPLVIIPTVYSYLYSRKHPNDDT